MIVASLSEKDNEFSFYVEGKFENDLKKIVSNKIEMSTKTPFDIGSIESTSRAPLIQSGIVSPRILNDIKTSINSLRGVDVDNSNIEIEARFGQFDRTFVPGVNRSTFIRIQNAFLKGSSYTYAHSKDEYFPPPPGSRENIRFTTIFNKNGLPESTFKTTKEDLFRHFDIPEYGVRISISRETNEDLSKPNLTPQLVREKKRWSFNLAKGKFRLDLTEVTSYSPVMAPIEKSDPLDIASAMSNLTLKQRQQRAAITAQTVYEIEVEILSPKYSNLDMLDIVLTKLLKEILETTMLYTLPEKQNVIDNINQYLGSTGRFINEIDHNVLSQARNIKSRDMVRGGLIPESDRNKYYTVTIKANGVRKLLVIDPNGIYLVSPPNTLSKILGPEVAGKLQTWHGTIIEGELIPKSGLEPEADEKYKNSSIYYVMYDLLALSKRDPQFPSASIRKQDLGTRLRMLQKAQIIFSESKGIIVEIKEFNPFRTIDEFYKEVDKTWNATYPFKTDGLIFTPWNNPYISNSEWFRIKLRDRKLSKYPDILKWKPLDQLTIDFEIFNVSVPEGNYVELLAVSYDPQPIVLIPERIIFTGTDENPFDPKTEILQNDILKNVANGTIVEFRWVQVEGVETTTANFLNYVPIVQKGKFEAIKPRPEKVKPNGIDVALDVWDDIHSPIDEEIILGKKFGLVIRYHNREKWNLFNTVGSGLSPPPQGGTRTLLDIGSGRGGDVYKWEANGFTHVICVEPNEDNRKELARRLSKTKLQYRIVPTIGQDIQQIYQNIQEFAPYKAVECVSFMLSLSFFYDKAESTYSIVQLVNATLMHGGYFIAFTIDGSYVLELFGNKKLVTAMNGIIKANFEQIDFQLRPPGITVQSGPVKSTEVGLTGGGVTETAPMGQTLTQLSRYNVFINIPDSIVQNQIEYLTNIGELKTLLGSIGLDLISENRANKEVFLNGEEVMFTQMYTGLVLKRK